MFFKFVLLMNFAIVACGAIAQDDIFYDANGNPYHTGLQKPKFAEEPTILRDTLGNEYRTGLIKPPDWKYSAKFKSVLVGLFPQQGFCKMSSG